MSFSNSIDVFVIMDVIEPRLSRSLMAILAGPHSLLLGPSVFGEPGLLIRSTTNQKIHLQT